MFVMCGHDCLYGGMDTCERSTQTPEEGAGVYGGNQIIMDSMWCGLLQLDQCLKQVTVHIQTKTPREYGS